MKNVRRFLVQILIFALMVALPDFSRVRAQEPVPSPTPTPEAIDKVELHQALLDLTNPWTVMCVAAHPDDEDGTTLTVLRRKYGVHTVSLFSTYGEGGQNAVGPELYEELGVIRARETMNAAQIQGSEPYFLGLKDFGYSKSAEETFKVWGHDEALRRMVLKIRELRPDVIITNHDTTSGHGHHQATGRLIIEAFDAAADAKRFPEQLQQTKPWHAQRLFVRMFGGGNEQKPEREARIVTIDPNEVDVVRGNSFAAQALVALQQHATQGPWPKSIAEWLKARRIEVGKLPLIRYRLVREAANAAAMPTASSTFLDGLKLSDRGRARFTAPMINDLPLTQFLDKPDQVLQALIDWRAAQPPSKPSGDDDARFQLLDARFNRAVKVAAGITFTVNSHPTIVVPGTSATFFVSLANSGERAVHIKRLSLDAGGIKAPLDVADQLAPDTETSLPVERVIPKSARVTLPAADHLYDGLLFGQSFIADAEMEVDGASFALQAERKIDVAPAVEIKNISPSPYVWTSGTTDRPLVFNMTLANYLAAPFKGTLMLRSTELQIFEFGRSVSLQPNETRDFTLQTSALPIALANPAGRGTSGLALLSVEQSDPQNTVTQRAVRLVYSDGRVARDLLVGYVPSFDQTLEHSLDALGVNARALSISDIQKDDLATYNSIIIDNRGYEAHPELIAENARLLDWVKNGGTLIVFYHKDNEWNPDPNKNRPQLAPYPILLGGDRVTDETAPIMFSQPGHPILNFPNRITQTDFDNWIQERGLYYPKEWDPHYRALFSTSDAGEKPLTGGLLVARYGRGNYIYSSMVWYRQLRAGVPGAYRVLANMISYGHLPRTPRRRSQVRTQGGGLRPQRPN